MKVTSGDWNIAGPEEKGIDPGNFAMMDREIFSKYPNVLSLLIIRDSSIVYERYYRQIGPDDAVPVMSVNKSVLSALIGIALEKGILSSLEQRVLDFFPEIDRGKIDPQVHRLTLRHLVTMSSGLYYLRLTGDAQPIWQRTINSRNWVEFILNLPVRDNMGQHFNYKNTDVHLAAACLCRSSGMTIGDLAKEWLFKPLDIDVPHWGAEDPQGIGIGPLYMRARDMASFGLLYLQEGLWREKQLIPKDWVKASISRQVGKYGYLWWIHDEGYSASGAGGALIRVIPSKRMVVVFQTKHLKRFKDPREIVDRYVIPAVH